jgi:SAM-dependent methyltransferase
VPGIGSSLLSLLAPRFWRQKYANWRARRFDRRHGIETSAVVPVVEMQDVDAALASHAVHYEPSTLPKFERAMRALPVEYSRYTFVDYGSGKGRVLLLAARYPFRRVIGVEMSAALTSVAAANVRSYERLNRLSTTIELVHGDARDFAVPEGDLIAYFYNPFDETVLETVWDHLRTSVRQTPRSLFIVYINPLHRRIFDQDAELHCVYTDASVAVYRGGFSEPPGMSGRPGIPKGE